MDTDCLHREVLWVMGRGVGSRVRKPVAWLLIPKEISRLCQLIWLRPNSYGAWFSDRPIYMAWFAEPANDKLGLRRSPPLCEYLHFLCRQMSTPATDMVYPGWVSRTWSTMARAVGLEY